MTEITLRYNGESTVNPTNQQRAYGIVDAFRSMFTDDTLDFEQGRVSGRDGQLQFRFSIRKQTTLADAQTDVDALAQQLVELGIEPDTDTAAANIRA